MIARSKKGRKINEPQNMRRPIILEKPTWVKNASSSAISSAPISSAIKSKCWDQPRFFLWYILSPY